MVNLNRQHMVNLNRHRVVTLTGICTYDIPSKHVDFKKMMFQLGYKDQIAGTTCKVIYFPNTTLYHPTKSAETARDEAQSTAQKLGISLERCVATQWINWAAICGEPFK